MCHTWIASDWSSFKPWNTIFSFVPVKDYLYFLEIGCFEGRTTCLILDTFNNSFIDCIDPFSEDPEYQTSMEGVYQSFRNNTSHYGDRVSLFRGTSFAMLPLIVSRGEMYDFVYVDGKHTKENVSFELKNVWKILNTNGLILCDDYDWSEVKDAINNFLRETKDAMVVHKTDTQLMMKKFS